MNRSPLRAFGARSGVKPKAFPGENASPGGTVPFPGRDQVQDSA